MTAICHFCGHEAYAAASGCESLEEAYDCWRFVKQCRKLPTVGELKAIAEDAAREWDATKPRWDMPRDEFIAWHIRMATGQLRSNL